MSFKSLSSCIVSANNLSQQICRYRLGQRKLHVFNFNLNKIKVEVTKSLENSQETKLKNINIVQFKNKLLNGPNLKDFIKVENQENITEEEVIPYLHNYNRFIYKVKTIFCLIF